MAEFAAAAHAASARGEVILPSYLLFQMARRNKVSVAQLVERRPYKTDVAGSIPAGDTSYRDDPDEVHHVAPSRAEVIENTRRYVREALPSANHLTHPGLFAENDSI